MSEQTEEQQSGGMSISDIYYVLFRQKRIILFCSAAGWVGALLLLFAIKPPIYQSEAKLFIRYISEGKSLNPSGNEAPTVPLNAQEASAINTELAILMSLDLAQQAAEAIGPEKLLGKATTGDSRSNRERAAVLVQHGLDIYPPQKGSVITVVFQHSNPQLAQQVLEKVVIAYLKKHAEMHQQVGIFGEFLTQQTSQLRAEIAQTDEELRKAKSKYGVASIDDTKKSYTEQISKIRENLFAAEAELAAHQAALGEVSKLVPAKSESTNNTPPTPLELVNEYKAVCARLDLDSKKEQEYLTQFTKESAPVQIIRRQINDAETEKRRLEEAYPTLASLAMTSSRLPGQPAGSSNDFATETVQVRALKSKVEVLTAQLRQIQGETAKLDEIEPVIQELQRKKDLAEANLKFFSGNLQVARFNETMGTERSPDISTIQSPSPPVKRWSKNFQKKVGMVAAGGMFGGLALAFLIEMLLDRTVKRPTEIETKLRLPLLISIPDISRNNASSSALATRSQIMAENSGLNRFYTGLRDRLLVNFEIRNVLHKPKLVAVTSCHKGAGVSSIAAGLAASLSETGDGNVLLVDMNPEQQVMQQFHKGKPAGGLASALEPETKEDGYVQEKLYVVTERTDDETISRFLPKRFSELVPKLKASDYDYIIFDMPPVTQTSVTPRLAGLMDMVLLVIESEKTNQDVVKRVNALLAESKANVSTVLNKTHTYIPARLHQEYLNDT